MRSKLWLAALPALLLGVVACDDQTAQNNTNPGATSTAERPATTPPPPAGTPGQNASGVPGAAPSATPAPGSTAPGGANSGGGGNTSSQ